MRNDQRGEASAIAVLALVVAIVALIVGWMAYNRTGADLEDRIRQQVDESAQTVEQGAQDAADAVDAGPDGVDEDDTDVNSTEPTTTQ